MIRGCVYRGDEMQPLFNDVGRTETAWERMRGLLGRPALGAEQGMLIVPCPSVHTAFMTQAIDVVFLDPQDRVSKCVAALVPWRMASCRRARATLELPPGSIARCAIVPGQVLRWRAG